MKDQSIAILQVFERRRVWKEAGAAVLGGGGGFRERWGRGDLYFGVVNLDSLFCARSHYWSRWGRKRSAQSSFRFF